MTARIWSRSALAVATLGLLVASCGSDPDVAIPDVPGSASGVVVDTDMGLDDALALLFLASRPDVAIRAVTVVGDGLAHCAPGVRNARALLAMTGHDDVPVACGGRRPLLGANAFPDEWREAADDLYGLEAPAATGAPLAISATELLHQALDGDTSLLTLGPYTNVATAIREDPELPGRVPTVVSMAGAVGVPGNAPNGVAEYNVWADPLAAKEVLAAMPVTLVPLDATNAVPVTSFFVDVLADHLGTPAADAAHGLIADDPFLVSGSYFFWDPLAAGLLVEPELGTYETRRLLVTASHDAGAGWIDDYEAGPEVRVATRADGLAFEAAFLSALTGEPVTEVRPSPDLEVSFDGTACELTPPADPRTGRTVVAFRNRASEDTVLTLVRFGDPVTFQDLVDAVGAPGSLVTGAPHGFRFVGEVVAPAGQDAWLAAELTGPNVATACLIPQDAGALVWLGGWFSLGA